MEKRDGKLVEGKQCWRGPGIPRGFKGSSEGQFCPELCWPKCIQQAWGKYNSLLGTRDLLDTGNGLEPPRDASSK